MSKNSDSNKAPATGNRALVKALPGIATSDGDGVLLTRIIGSPQLNMLDPFLLLDCFESDEAQDYIGGFPEHPHRGFETVTYLLNGRMRHRDNAGNEGVIEPGGVQWMTAGKGIVHSEMPEQEQGLMKGFQLWVNLPASAKMTEPAYQEYPPESTPLERRDDGTEIRVIAGKTNLGTVGPVINEYTYPTYMDITLPAGTVFQQSIAAQHNAFIYVIEGALEVVGTSVESSADAQQLGTKTLGILGPGNQLSVVSKNAGSRFLLVAGRPLNEPVARGGPFVMNTREQVMQAYADFSRGQF
jgi:redox-sensitive bicupin YhaK (pirin superfamily)